MIRDQRIIPPHYRPFKLRHRLILRLNTLVARAHPKGLVRDDVV